MGLFEIGVCIGGFGVIIMLILANDNRKDRTESKSNKVMFKVGAIMALIGGVLGSIGMIITKLVG